MLLCIFLFGAAGWHTEHESGRDRMERMELDVDLDAVVVGNNEAEQRYEARVHGRLAVIDYRLAGDRIALIHAGVPKELRGRGLAARMTRVALEDARARHLAVIPRCPYVAAYIRRHPEYRDLVAPEASERVARLSEPGKANKRES